MPRRALRLRGSFKEAAAAPHDRVLAVLSEMAKAWPQDRESRDALWNRAEAIAVRDHQDRLTEIREADDPKRGDYRRADMARSALAEELGEGNYSKEQVRPVPPHSRKPKPTALRPVRPPPPRPSHSWTGGGKASEGIQPGAI